jgi:prepilin-type N-terminal cleavage/methylation domain-containing protein
MTNNKKSGFTLIEVLVATFILLIGLLGMNSVLISSIKYNEANQARIIAQKVLKGTISELRGITLSNFTKSNLKSKFGFSDNIPLGYPSGGEIGGNCPSGYDYKIYKTYDIEKKINGTNMYYKYTIKLCVDSDYLLPYLERAIITIYWNYAHKLKKIESRIFITSGE